MYAAKTLDSVDALNRILDIATAFWKSQTFFTACQLGVFAGQRVEYNAMRMARRRGAARQRHGRLRHGEAEPGCLSKLAAPHDDGGLQTPVRRTSGRKRRSSGGS